MTQRRMWMWLVAAVVIGAGPGCAPMVGVGGDIPADCLPPGDDGDDSDYGPDPAPQPGDCNVMPLGYHRGGHVRHNECADFFPPNTYWDQANVPRGKGSDAVLGGKSFDAYKEVVNGGQVTKRIVYEMKVGNYSQYCGFLKNKYMDKTLDDAKIEMDTARKCGYEYWLVASDGPFYNDLLRVQQGQPVPGLAVKPRFLDPAVIVEVAGGCR